MSKAEEDKEREPGRPRQLKSYLIESNSKILNDFETREFKVLMKPTEVKGIKSIIVTYGQNTVPFFLDSSHERFWILHTNALSTTANNCVNKLINTDKFEFDRAWFSSNMLSKISDMPGNSYRGFKTKYKDLFLEEDQEVPVQELRITISGNSSNKALEAIQREKDLQNSLAFAGVRIRRGTRPVYTENDLSYHGAFVVKKGTSIDDHITLVENAKKHYQEKMYEIEDFRIGVKTEENRTLIEGKAFDFEFDRIIEDIDIFIEKMTSPTFRLWGLKKKIGNEHYQFLAVDLHTGDPFDLEITKNFMRVYLPEGSCGNVVLRLLVNLQQSFDSRIRCESLGLYGANA